MCPDVLTLGDLTKSPLAEDIENEIPSIQRQVSSSKRKPEIGHPLVTCSVVGRQDIIDVENVIIVLVV